MTPRKQTHPSVGMARLSLLVVSAMGAWNLWTVVALAAGWLVIGVGLVLVLLLWVGKRRLRIDEARKNQALEVPHRWAWTPVVLVVAAILGYGVVIAKVHEHYFARRTSEFVRASKKVDPEISREGVAFEAQARAIDRETKRLHLHRSRNAQLTSG